MHRATLSRPDTAPAQASLEFTAALNAGELDAATACFARDACLVAPGATAIHGREEIRALLAQMIARGSHIEVTHSTVLCAGEVALARQRWIVSSRGVGDDRYAQNLSPCLVMRLLEDSWRLAIAMPWD